MIFIQYNGGQLLPQLGIHDTMIEGFALYSTYSNISRAVGTNKGTKRHLSKGSWLILCQCSKKYRMFRDLDYLPLSKYDSVGY